MNNGPYRARIKRLEASFPKPDTKFTIEISPLPDEAERRRIEAANPDEEFIWIEAEKVSS